MTGHDVLDAAWLSTITALAATLVAAGPAVLAGTWLARTRSRWRPLVQGVVMAPLVLPPIVTGYGLLLVLGRHGPLSGLGLAFTWWAAVLAGAVVGLPLFVRGVELAVSRVDPQVEAAAATLGASPWRVWRTITLPIAAPGVAMGGMLCMARALGEFGATIVVAGNIAGETRTVPLALFSALQVPGGELRAATLAGVAMGLALAGLGLAEVAARTVGRR